MVVLQLPVEMLTQLVTIAGAVMLAVMLAALVGFAYQSLTGDGIEWPDDDAGGEGVQRRADGDDDDEWKYY
ncbi:hypothetical protein [Halobellus ruber]|uniref:Uncharacterized protein n=1 Tax=Halobellus ruber TaxID=2761102 RepID=A0A7J9SI69_9EURY|nr:hypothetical protein [Halobellus ruber]MBB6646660.1 hypothetical protein [Halobellus ruber]